MSDKLCLAEMSGPGTIMCYEDMGHKGPHKTREAISEFKVHQIHWADELSKDA